jgi:hypothetical protein
MVRRNIALFAAGGALGLALVLGVYGIAVIRPAKLASESPAPETRGTAARPAPAPPPPSPAARPARRPFRLHRVRRR